MRKKRFRFSKQEIKEMILSALVLAFVFGYPFSDSGFLFEMGRSFLFVGLAFILHETAHKLTAQSFGCWSEYRMWLEGLMLALVLRLLGSSFIFAAPGATYYSPSIGGFTFLHLSDEQIGKIAISGPLTNIVLAVIFSLLGRLIPGSYPFFELGIAVNLGLAFFNLLPIPPMDGRKIMAWSFSKWLSAILGVMVLMIIL